MSTMVVHPIRAAAASSGQAVQPGMCKSGPIVLGKSVLIGMRAVRVPGVVLEEEVIVAAGSVATKSSPPFAVVGGNPATVIMGAQENWARYKEQADTFEAQWRHSDF